MAKPYPTYDVTHKKRNPKPKKNPLQTTTLTDSFEGLHSSLAQSSDELWNCKDLANMDKLYLMA